MPGTTLSLIQEYKVIAINTNTNHGIMVITAGKCSECLTTLTKCKPDYIDYKIHWTGQQVDELQFSTLEYKYDM